MEYLAIIGSKVCGHIYIGRIFSWNWNITVLRCHSREPSVKQHLKRKILAINVGSHMEIRRDKER